MKLTNLLSLVAILAVATSCDYQKNNTIKQRDVRKGDEYVYGVHPDSAAAQSKLKYDAKPELEVKANAIREKLFKGKAINQGN
jgi:LmbE family N-acetylglucosaminyl deacetylase